MAVAQWPEIRAAEARGVYEGRKPPINATFHATNSAAKTESRSMRRSTPPTLRRSRAASYRIVEIAHEGIRLAIDASAAAGEAALHLRKQILKFVDKRAHPVVQRCQQRYHLGYWDTHLWHPVGFFIRHCSLPS
jgi:hypothetical protein